MKASAMYRNAAEIAMTNARQSCLAICDALCATGWPDEAQAYEDLFSPYEYPSCSEWGMKWSDSLSEVQDCRILALCFMAAIAESEGN